MSILKKLFGRTPEIMDWRDFTEHYAAAARREAGVEAHIEWGADIEETSVIITLPDGTQGSCYMGNYYTRYRQDPGSLDELTRQALLPIAQMSGQIEDRVRTDNILPVLKNTGYLQHMQDLYRKDRKDPEEFICFRPLAGDVVVMYMVDCGETMRGLQRSEPAEIGLADADALHAQALHNLGELAGQIQIARSGSNSLHRLILDTSYDASLALLAPHILEAAEIRLPGRTVLAFPARDSLFVCGSEDPAALAQLNEIVAEAAADSPYQISSELYIYDEKGKISLFHAN